MSISTKGRYALRVMLDITLRGGNGPVPLNVVAHRQGLSTKYLEQVVSPLVKAGLLESVRGAQGGYVLTRTPNQITAGDVLRAGEGSLSPVPCLMNKIDCPREDVCMTLPFWRGLEETVDAYINGVTLADMAQMEGAEEESCHESDF